MKRKYYKISEEGIEFYKEKKVEWKELKQFLDTFLEGGY
ncbi:Transcriptional regulator, PadR [Bacillus cereus BDRD-Cer4]|nr:Transcriptional regulator, PadR [Bacillus cereus BDRD-Cer4]